ncbi:hypothetical protein BDV96DRAFT_596205 [Lophiotrema nucula]|uniref:RING-type domain-containing protein n=1 Tax=Lophiotrema nucula TaxID=690887 RepID=A0A6A5ZIQ8_9PLEO|nr:hypothetical protein BDV96DRAFT_596205 [Lophiotrema nucula]
MDSRSTPISFEVFETCYLHPTSQRQLPEEPCCPICFENYDDQDHQPTRVLIENCHHVFGLSCLNNMFSRRRDQNAVNRCPLCRTEWFMSEYTPEAQERANMELLRQISPSSIYLPGHANGTMDGTQMTNHFLTFPSLLPHSHRPHHVAPTVPSANLMAVRSQALNQSTSNQQSTSLHNLTTEQRVGLIAAARRRQAGDTRNVPGIIQRLFDIFSEQDADTGRQINTVAQAGNGNQATLSTREHDLDAREDGLNAMEDGLNSRANSINERERALRERERAIQRQHELVNQRAVEVETRDRHLNIREATVFDREVRVQERERLLERREEVLFEEGYNDEQQNYNERAVNRTLRRENRRWYQV